MLMVLKQIIAAGPFTTIDNLLFEPLVELLAYAKRRQPQLLVLVHALYFNLHLFIIIILLGLGQYVLDHIRVQT